MKFQKFDDLPIKRKVLASNVVPLGFLFLIAVVAIIAMSFVSYTVGKVDHTKQALKKGDGIIATAVDMESGMRGFLLAGQEAFLEPYNSGRDRIFSDIADLKKTVADEPEQINRLEEAENIIRTWQEDVAAIQIGLRREIANSKRVSEVNDIVGEARGQEYLDDFERQIKSFIAGEQASLEDIQAEFAAMNARGAYNPAGMQQMMGQITETHDTLAKARAMLAAVTTMESGMRGFLLVGQPAFLEPFEAGAANFDRLGAELADRVVRNPAQGAILSEAQGTINAWRTGVAQPMIDLRAEIGDAKTMDNMADLIAEARGKSYFEKFRALMTAFHNEEEALMGVRMANRQTAETMAISAIALMMCVSMVAGFLMARRVGEGISGPIGQIVVAMQKIIDGEKNVPISGQTRKDEVGDMARATLVFSENAAKVVELANAEAQNARKLEESSKNAAAEAAATAEKERKDRAEAQRRQYMVDKFQEAINAVVEGAVRGNFAHRIDADFEDQDLGSLANRVNDLMEVVQNGLDRTSEVLNEFASGSLSTRMTGDFEGAFANLQTDLNATIDRFEVLIGSIADASETVVVNAEKIDGGSVKLSSRSSEQAAALEETAAAIEEMSATVKTNAENAEQAQKISETSAKKADEGSHAIQDAISAMSRIEESSGEMRAIVDMIETLSFQTNLLSLNASVEAARAGEAGKGFSVVASEVRALAQRSADAATSIHKLIEGSQDSISDGSRLINVAGKILEELDAAVGAVKSVVSDISVATQEQASGINEIVTAVSSIDVMTQKNAAMAEDNTGTAKEMIRDAIELKQKLAFFSAKAGGESLYQAAG